MTDPDTHERERFQKIESIFAELCDLSPDHARNRLSELALEDQSIIDAVVAMLDADQQSHQAIDRGVLFDPPDHTDQLPESIGDYRILRVLGEGGMGVVYEAVQSNPTRHVALKIIRERSMHAKIGKRFQSEADILAKMNHPGIATIYASGIGEGDHGPVPFVAMELVLGDSITKHCASLNLRARQRLELMRDVCRAVGYAHTLGVVHRDLKPSNILVDGSGQIKILDFGIAVDISIADRTQMTQTGQLIGTLKYMAPEQMERQRGTGCTQTDVYALGLICYEVLAGRSPLDSFEESVLGMVRAIGDKEHTMLGSLDRSFRGDIETIVAKAMSREIGRRYENAGDLADDLDRFLNNQPIRARRPSGWYQFRKFTKRNPVVVGSVGAVMLVLLLSLFLISSALHEATRERLRAEREQYSQALINSFLTEDLFAAADPERGGDPGMTLLDAMRASSSQIPIRFKDAPEAQASISDTIGNQFRMMNDFDEALMHLRNSVELTEQLGLPVDVLVDRRNSLADVYMDIDDLDTALSILEENDRIAENAHDEISPGIVIDTLVQHASLLYYKKDYAQCAAVFEQAVAIGRSKAQDYPGYDDAISGLAVAYTSLGELDKALMLHEEGIHRRTEELGPEHPSTLLARDNLAILYLQMGRDHDALGLSKDVLELRMKIFGPDHAKTHLTEALIAQALTRLERYEEAEMYAIRAYNGLVNLLGPDHRYTLSAGRIAFELYTRWGKTDLAERFSR